MSLDLEARMRIFHASAQPTIHRVQTVEISHSAMSRPFRLWREPYAGVTYANGVPLAVEPSNMEIKVAGSAGHLDQIFNINLGLVDSMDVFRDELARVPLDTKESPRIVYREYLSDDLSTPQATAILQAESTNWIKGAASISAVSPRFNVTRTGELYTPKDIPMLRGFL